MIGDLGASSPSSWSPSLARGDKQSWAMNLGARWMVTERLHCVAIAAKDDFQSYSLKWTDLDSHTRSLYWIVHLESLEKADPGAPLLSPRQKAQWGLESGPLNYSSSFTRRHQEQGKRRGQELPQPQENSRSHPANMRPVISFYSLKKYIYLFF